jgi:hypothetical protein
LILVVAACGGGSPGTITVTSPTGLGELVPTQTIDIAWTVGGDFDPKAVEVDVLLRGTTEQRHVISPAMNESLATTTGFTWDGRVFDDPTDLALHAAAPGYYDLLVGDGGALVDAGDSHVVVVQGVSITQPAPGATLTVPGDIDFTTSTTSTLDVQLLADQTMIEDVSVPGELHSVSRTTTFDGPPLAKGTYALSAHVTDAAVGVSYDVPGGTLIVP